MSNSKTYSRRTIGKVLKGKKLEDGTTSPDYIQIRSDLTEPVVLTPGTYLNLESKASQLASLGNAITSGRISEENAEKVRERLNKIPDFVRFEIVQVLK